MAHYKAHRFVTALLGLLIATLGLAGTPAAASSRTPSPADWLLWTPSTRTVTLTLIAGYNAARHGFNFNGYSTGTMAISVPVGVRVNVIFRNQGRSPHSAIITPYTARTGTSKGRTPLAFPGAYTPDPTHGIAPGQTRRFSFVAGRVGRYAVVSSAAHDQQAGMWDLFQITVKGEPYLTVPQ